MTNLNKFINNIIFKIWIEIPESTVFHEFWQLLIFSALNQSDIWALFFARFLPRLPGCNLYVKNSFFTTLYWCNFTGIQVWEISNKVQESVALLRVTWGRYNPILSPLHIVVEQQLLIPDFLPEFLETSGDQENLIFLEKVAKSGIEPGSTGWKSDN